MSQSDLLSENDVEAMLRRGFPHDPDVEALTVLEVSESTCVIRLDYDQRQLRPGGTISGPTLMKLADTAMYGAVMGAFQSLPVAFTTNLTIEFMRRPGPGAVRARAEIVKHGRTRLTGRVDLFSESVDEPVASALVSYQVAGSQEK